MAKVLVCDDDKEIVEAIDIYLTQEGYEVFKAYDGQEALEVLKKESVDLLVIDVMMPRLDGIRATLKIREENNIPIIILSAKSEDADKILGLNVGADDYVTKPFNPLELVARVKSQLRRYTQLGSTAQPAGEKIYATGGLMINDDLKEVTVDGEPVKLTPIEYNILLLLVRNQGKVFSIDQIYENIWNEDAIGVDNTVAVHIRHIRVKLALQHFHHIHNAPCIVEIHHRIGTAWHHCVDTVDLFGIPFEILQAERDPQLIGKGQDVEHRVGGACYRQVEHDGIQKHFSGDQL